MNKCGTGHGNGTESCSVPNGLFREKALLQGRFGREMEQDNKIFLIEQINGVFIKDLSKLGRDLTKILIIDNNKDNFSLQPENGLHIIINVIFL